jgi:hypothetical protein
LVAGVISLVFLALAAIAIAKQPTKKEEIHQEENQA